MPLRLYADECVDARIVNGLRRRGIDIVTVVDEGLISAPDETHLQRAIALGRVIMTADKDFLRLAHATATSGGHHPGVLYILPATPVGEAPVDRHAVPRHDGGGDGRLGRMDPVGIGTGFPALPPVEHESPVRRGLAPAWRGTSGASRLLSARSRSR
jgi:hypothetical protein